MYKDPPAKLGTVEDALRNTLVSTLDLSPISPTEADQILPAGTRCTFHRSRESDPILWVAQGDNEGAMKLNGVLVSLGARGETDSGGVAFATPGIKVTMNPLATEADWRSNAELLFVLDAGLSVGYRGFWSCSG